MCLSTPKVSAPKIAAYDNSEAMRQSDIEARLRRRRSGAAANVLTGAMGIPSGQSTSQLGGRVA
ncbi:hypothetical protein [Oceaniglobus trochenteri]|uniref:hypothetical protein n=1 Tax=Oceaniglobus trochenteri TaxID=2763260 RepID=UPI001CFFC8DA|nr:hypothetical protein [Oceaniglobus trochenteri]